MHSYNPKNIEKKWQEYWKKDNTFETPRVSDPEKKMYVLPQLPYPSGSGLHVGHAEVYTACDIVARYNRMNGKEVLQVIGWDSFGLPAENYAIKTNIHPRESTNNAIANFRSQIKALGISVDWERETGSHNSDYYKWTQWFFLLMYKRGLAYRKKQAVNWCDSCKTVLANEQVVNGHCERCDTVVIQKEMEQWYLKITEYADKLIEGLDRIDWPEETKKRQKNWIGRSEGAEIQFFLISGDSSTPFRSSQDDILSVTVFTTRPDTIFGVTYMVLAPEHVLVHELQSSIENWDDVQAYIDVTTKKTDLERQVDQEKMGVELKGVKAINPVNGEEIPVWIADYVLASYGTGAIMAVPAHDERDFSFAKKFGLSIRTVVDKDKHLIFDFDGVLGNTFEACIHALVEGGNEANFDDAKKHAVEYASQKPNHTRDHSLTPEELQGQKEWSRAFGEAMSKQKIELFDEFITEIAKLKNIQVGVVSSGSELYVKPAMEQSALDPTHILTFEHHHSKEEKIEMICKDWGVVVEDIYYFTDTKADVYELENFLTKGHLIGCAWGFSGKEDLESVLGREHVLETHEDIHRLFDTLHVGEGTIVNSDFLNGLHNSEAIHKAMDWLEEKGVGKRKVQYKLRDWSVSRQRFWGAPIPMIKNEHEKNKKRRYIFVHGFGGSSESNFFPWLKQQLEEQGHHVVALDLPHTDTPNVQEQAEYVFAHTDIDEYTVIVAHSLGGPVTFRVLEQLSKRIAKVVLVDPVVRPEFNDGERESVQVSDSFDFDFQKIKHAAREFVILGDAQHVTIKGEHLEELAKILDARLVTVNLPERHFMVAEEPTVLEESLVSGLRPVDMDDLPVILPDDVDFKPTGQSPLTYSERFQNGVEDQYGNGWQREVDTLDTFMCSSWYYYRYLDPKNNHAFASPEALKTWMPVDFYLGGEEHVNGHLLYARFFTKVLFDAGYIDFDEPFKKHRHQGLILGEDSRKMSKRWGNVINPTDVIEVYGADTCRMYEMFMGPLEDTKPWSDSGVKGVRRFLDRVWRLFVDDRTGILRESVSDRETTVEQELLIHKTIKKVSYDTAHLQFNTAVSAMMEFVNEANKWETVPHSIAKRFVLLLSPFAPHVAEELWQKFGGTKTISFELWPTYDENKLMSDTIMLAVQVNGKVRDTIEVAIDLEEAAIKGMALGTEKIQKWLEGKEPKKVIYVKGKLVSVVV